MASSSDEEELPAQLLDELLQALGQLTADSSDSQRRACVDAQSQRIASLYSHHTPAHRSQLAQLSYSAGWQPLARHCCALLPTLLDEAGAADADSGAARA